MLPGSPSAVVGRPGRDDQQRGRGKRGLAAASCRGHLSQGNGGSAAASPLRFRFLFAQIAVVDGIFSSFSRYLFLSLSIGSSRLHALPTLKPNSIPYSRAISSSQSSICHKTLQHVVQSKPAAASLSSSVRKMIALLYHHGVQPLVVKLPRRSGDAAANRRRKLGAGGPTRVDPGHVRRLRWQKG